MGRPGTTEDSATSELRARLVGLLEYPRRLMEGSVALEACAHAGHYAPRAQDCQACEHGPECQWLLRHDGASDLGNRSVASLGDALELCYAYVDARVTIHGHDNGRCGCEACRWLRTAEGLLDVLRSTL
jgi:hypothetical protein